jgi:hypothetical protein
MWFTDFSRTSSGQGAGKKIKIKHQINIFLFLRREFWPGGNKMKVPMAL